MKMDEKELTKEVLFKKFNLESDCNFRTAVNLVLSEYKNYSFKNDNVDQIISTVMDLLVNSESKNDQDLIIAAHILNSLELEK